MLRLGLGATRRMWVLSEQDLTIRARCVEAPYQYLNLIGLHPGHQGRRVGSRFFESMIRRFAQPGVSLTCETQSEATVAWMERFGFTVVGQTTYPGSTIRSWVLEMPRCPRHT